MGIKKDVCTYYIPNFHRKALKTRRANGRNERGGRAIAIALQLSRPHTLLV
jgi:hypothetical protein